MKHKNWEAIHEVYARLETLCHRSLYNGEGLSAGDGAAEQEEGRQSLSGQGGASAHAADLVVVRGEIRTQLDFLRATLSEQYSERDTYLILFPVVAQIDELILARYLHKMRTSWPPLQKELFQIENAGEVFYEILDDILLKPQTPLFIFEVYYFCLSYGFRGRYQDNPVKVKEYMKNLDIKLQQDDLPIAATETEEGVVVGHRGSPYWNYLAAAAVVTAFFFVLAFAGRNMF